MRSFLLVSLLLTLVACQGRPQPLAEDLPREGKAPLEASNDGAEAKPLSFPPMPSRRARRPLPAPLGQVAMQEAIAVESPVLDGQRHFEFVGSSLRIRFNRELADKATRAAVPPIQMTPAVEGKARWLGKYSIEFQADAPFDPQTRYAITLEGLTEASGATIPTWTATFRADPRIWIGHKMIAYVPVPQQPRKVDVRPFAGSKVSVRPKLSVLWDQPVTLAEVESLITLTSSGEPVPVRLRHPRRGKFDGAAVDARHIVEIRPRRALPPGTQLELGVRDHGEASTIHTYPLEVAQPLRFQEVACPSESSCAWDPRSNTVTIRDNAMELVFNHTLVESGVEQHVRIEPEVSHLSMWSSPWTSDGRLSINGSFSPSSTYRLIMTGLRDVYGNTLPEASIRVATAPESASVTMQEGWTTLDAAQSRAFEVRGRNVQRAALKVWTLEETEAAWNDAHQRLMRREVPADAPSLEIPISFAAEENAFVTATVDLLEHLQAGRSYLTSLEVQEPAFSAPLPPHPEWSWAARPPMNLLTPSDANGLLVHARTTTQQALVQVSTRARGLPVAGAQLFLDGKLIMGTSTDPHGVARFVLPEGTPRGAVLRVEHGEQTAQLPLGLRTQTPTDLFPDLARGRVDPPGRLRGWVMSDRGIYRPQATMHFKATVRHPADDGTLQPVPLLPVRVRVFAPSGRDVLDHRGWTNEMGSLALDHRVAPTAELGRYRVVLEALLGGEVVAEGQVQVAEFEPPRFKVDVDAQVEDTMLQAKVEGRYLFGAAMEQASVSWTLRREPEAFPHGPLVARGLNFRPYTEETAVWSSMGQGALDEHGDYLVRERLEVLPNAGPQRFTVEAEVQDTSHRAIANRSSVVVHPQPVYSGVRLLDRWPAVGKPLPVEFGVVDTEGRSVEGRAIRAQLRHLDWKRVRQPGPGGSARVTWTPVRTIVDTCSVTSGRDVVQCSLTPRKSGSYEVDVSVEGVAGGTARAWAWGSDGPTVAQPSEGVRLELEADRTSYSPGDTATLRFHNPFPQATALYTLEHEGSIEHRVETIPAGPRTVSMPLRAEHTPQAYATVTLLPAHDSSASAEDPRAVVQWRIGAVKLGVEPRHARLEVKVDSDRAHYEPTEAAKITVHVTHEGKPVQGADIALAVVDEGVLRVTNFHALDPVAALRPAQALNFTLADSRLALAEMLDRQSVAGDGEGSGQSSIVQSRKDFVQTALWRPHLRSDASGKVTAILDLPDNLTSFRMMAVVVDAEGRGGHDEANFEVRKPWMGVPVVPRFAMVGDALEAALMVHNNDDAPAKATVALGGKRQTVDLPPRGRARVAFPWHPQAAGEERFEFSLEDPSGRVRDRVEVTVPVVAPGIDERPLLLGSFRGTQAIALHVPAGIHQASTADDALWLTMGAQLRPDLGARLEYLVDYPHGCVEQTTSGLLPLLAARDILPRLGFLRYSREEIDRRVAAGLERLGTMKTPSGGLAYWPGGTEADVYGTAYAMRALALAERAGISAPAGLLDDAAGYLESQLLGDTSLHAEMQSSIALALGEAGRLPASSAAMLLDTQPQQSAFGLANLALALATLEGHEDHVQRLLTALEDAFDERGQPRTSAETRDSYYGSPERSQAQALLALTRLSSTATELPNRLEAALIRKTSAYTTQGTAFGLIALRERILHTPVTPGAWTVHLAGEALSADPSSDALEGYGQRYRIPWSAVAGRHAQLELHSANEGPIAFTLQSHWVRPDDMAGSMTATAGEYGPELYRLYTTPQGDPVDLSAIQAGQQLRVALLARRAESTPIESLSHLALTDRIPAGFEAVESALWTVSRPADLTERHPLYALLQWGGGTASHMEFRDDRVHLYFDTFETDYVAATYLLRATTPGRFNTPAASAEFMYEADSTSYSDAQVIEVVP